MKEWRNKPPVKEPFIDSIKQRKKLKDDMFFNLIIQKTTRFDYGKNKGDKQRSKIKIEVT